MRFNRSALVAGLLALGVAACGDDVEIVQPTPPVAPPPPPVTATMAPASASVLIGNSVVFAVNASGGVAGDAASWTCASSNTGIATVSVVSAGCQATGVAAGDVSITATVTKSGETVNVGAQLTVTEEATGEPAFLILKGVTGAPATEGGDPTNAGGLKGRVNVSLGVERGDQTLERLSVLIDGEVVAYQSFGSSMDMGMAAPEDDAAAEQAVYDFTLSFDSDEYDAETGATTHANGEHSLSAELQIAGGMMSDGMMGHETISSNVMTVEFDNADGYVVTADLGHNSALDDDGSRWYGGPDNGHILISALAVSYSGAEATTVLVELAGCDREEGDDDDDHGGPGVSFEFDCDGDAADRKISVTADGEPDQTILNEDDLPTANIDMAGPANAPMILANRNGREDGWINATVGLAGKFNANNAKDNWLVEGMGGAGDTGVGGYNMGIRIGANLKAAVRAGASSLPAESAGNDAYCAVAVAMDDLGNMVVPDTTGTPTPTCRTAPGGTDVRLTFELDADGNAAADTTMAYGYDNNADGDDDPDTEGTAGDVSRANSTLEFGVDTTAPVIELGDDEYDMRTTAFGTDFTGGIAFEPADDESDIGNSGLHEDNRLMVKAERRTASGTQCITVSTADGTEGSVAADAARNRRCTYAAIGDNAVTLAARTGEQAYWTVSGQAHDKAGNSSTVVSHTFAYDQVAARATAPAAPGAVTAGKPFQGATYLNDGLSIRDYYGTMNYGDPAATGLSLGIGAPVVVDAFNAATLTNVNHAVTASVGIVTTAGVIDPYAATQAAEVADVAAAVDGTLQPISGVSIGVRDQAGAYVVESTTIADASVTGQVADSLGVVTSKVGLGAGGFVFRYPGTATTYTVCGYAKCENVTGTTAPPPSTVKIEVRATAAALGAFRDPFERVDFWMTDANGVAWLVGSDATGASGRVGGTANDRTRTWTYSVTLAGTALRAATRPGTAATNDADIGKIVAIGVSGRGVGLVEVMDAAVEFGTEDEDD